MGCWNGTCVLSNLPIRDGDDVGIVFMVDIVDRDQPKGSAMGGVCYSHHFATPISPIFYGKYSDYGTAENIEKNEVYDRFLQLVNKNISQEDTIERMEKKSPGEFEDLESMMEWIQQDGVMLKYRKWHNRNDINPSLGFVMFHRSVFEALKQKTNYKIHYSKTEKGTFDDLVDAGIRIPEIINEAKLRKLEQFRVIWKEVATPEDNITDLDIAHLCSGLDSYHNAIWKFSNETKNDLYNWYSIFFIRSSGYPTCEQEMTLRGWLAKIIYDTPTKKEIEILAEFIVLYNTMELTRKNWMPQAGAGSQSQEYDLYKIIFMSGMDIISAYEKECEEDYEDGDELDTE